MVMSLIESLTNIKNAVYGREVREAIHDGVFRANQIADGADAKADKTQIRQDAVEDFNTQVIQEMTDKDVISAPEIIQARGGEPTLSGRINRDVLAITARLDDNAISPDDFEGTDKSKLQQAIDHVLATPKRGIRLSRMFDITGEGPLLINKETGERSKIIYFYGVGGGIKKTDAGFMFDSALTMSGDINFNTCIFESNIGSDTVVFSSKIIRVTDLGSSFRYVDHLFNSGTGYMQTYNMMAINVVGGAGSFVKTAGAYDVLFSGGFVEHRANFFEQVEKTGEFSNLYNVSFRDFMVEGLSGFAYKFHKVISVTLDGGYLEQNKGGDITFTNAPSINTIKISNISASKGNSDHSAFIQWRGSPIHAKVEYVNVNGYQLNDTTGMSGGYVFVENCANGGLKVGNVDPGKRVVTLDTRYNYSTDAEGGTTTNLGLMYRYKKSQTAHLPPNSFAEYEISVGTDVDSDTIISTQIAFTDPTPNKKVIVGNIVSDRTDKRKLRVNIKNEESVTVITVLNITLLKMYLTPTG